MHLQAFLNPKRLGVALASMEGLRASKVVHLRLQPTGWSMEHSVGGVKFTVIEVEPFAG